MLDLVGGKMNGHSLLTQDEGDRSNLRKNWRTVEKKLQELAENHIAHSQQKDPVGQAIVEERAQDLGIPKYALHAWVRKIKGSGKTFDRDIAKFKTKLGFAHLK